MSLGIWLSALVIITGVACSGSLRADGDSTAQHTLHIARMTWTGAYVGVHGGYAKSDADWSYTNISPYSAPGPDGPITTPGVGISPDGFNFGGQLGANHQFGQLMIGVEASFAGMNLESTRTNPGQFLPAFSPYRRMSKIFSWSPADLVGRGTRAGSVMSRAATRGQK
jgi:opacity protein-like surface antigen